LCYHPALIIVHVQNESDSNPSHLCSFVVNTHLLSNRSLALECQRLVTYFGSYGLCRRNCSSRGSWFVGFSCSFDCGAKEGLCFTGKINESFRSQRSRFTSNGTEFKPTNIPYVILGAGLCGLAWFGFNGGSALAADSIDCFPAVVATNLAAAAHWMANCCKRLPLITQSESSN